MGNKLIALYQDRIVLAGSDIDAQQWYMSRSGSPTDFDYSARDDNVLRAMSGGNSEAGKIPQDVTALIAFTDDYLVFGTINEIYTMLGNPAAGGIIDNKSKAIGIIDQGSWAHGEFSEIWFVSRNGLCMLEPGVQGYPTPRSRQSLPTDLINIDPNLVRMNVAYDLEERGLHIFLTPTVDNDATRISWFYDRESDGFWPVTLDAEKHVTSILAYSVDYGIQNRVYVGCRDTVIRRYMDAVATDDDSAISSYIWIGPIPLGQGGNQEGALRELVAALADKSGDITWSVHVGASAEEAFRAPSFTSGTWSAGYNYASRPHAGGAFAYVKLSATTRWALEEIHSIIEPKGMRRKP